MCNLYRLTRAPDEVAKLFGLQADIGANLASEVYPGYPGAVIAEGGLQAMVWGFPLAMKSKSTGKPLKPKPVNNARTDKLDGFFWRHSFEHRRCLIPLDAWAEAEGPRGSMTRTWLSLPDAEPFTVAGIWRKSDEWGDCYSMVMTDAAGDAAQVHSRMPVILVAEDRERWMSSPPDEARALCRPYPAQLVIDRTGEPWHRR